MTVTLEIPDNAKIIVLCDGQKHCCYESRYKPGYWNGINGGAYYAQYFDMQDVNRLKEMSEIAEVLAENGIDFSLVKLKKQYRIAVTKNDYFRMGETIKKRIFDINFNHSSFGNF